MDLELSTGDEIPEHDTRLLVRNISNYLPEYTSLVKVIPDPNKVDSMIAQAMGGSAVRYTGVKSEVTVKEEKATLMSKVFGAKKTEEVIRTDVEGLLWCRPTEVNNVGVGRNQLCNLEFDASQHTALDIFCDVPGINAFLTHPQVSIDYIKECVTTFGKQELEFLTRVVGVEAEIEAIAPEVAGMKVSKRRDTSLLVEFPELNRAAIFSYISQHLCEARNLDSGDGVSIGVEPTSRQYLVKGDNGYSIYSVDISPLVETFGAGCASLSGAGKLSDFALKLAELEKVRVNGFGYIRDNFCVVVPSEKTQLMEAPLPSTFGKTDVELLISSVPKLVELLQLPELKGIEQNVFDSIVKKPQNVPLVTGILKLLALPVNDRSVLEEKARSMDAERRDAIARSSSMQESWLHNNKSKSVPQTTHSPAFWRYLAAKDLAETAYNICKSDKKAVGVTIRQGGKTKNRRYLRWENGEFSVTNLIASVSAKVPTSISQQQSTTIWEKYKPNGAFMACPSFIASADPLVVAKLFSILGVGNYARPGLAVPGRKSAPLGKLSQICELKKNQKVLIADADKRSDKIYALRDSNGDFMLRKFYNTRPNVDLGTVEYMQTGVAEAGSLPSYEKSLENIQIYLGKTESTPQSIQSPEKSIELTFKTDYPKELTRSTDSSMQLAETAGMELTRLMKSGLSLNKAVTALLTDARFKPKGLIATLAAKDEAFAGLVFE